MLAMTAPLKVGEVLRDGAQPVANTDENTSGVHFTTLLGLFCFGFTREQLITSIACLYNVSPVVRLADVLHQRQIPLVRSHYEATPLFSM